MSASSSANTRLSSRGFSGGGVADQALDDREIELFEAARALPLSKRSVWLVAECGDYPDLLAAIQDRLSWEARMEGFLLAPVLPRGDASEEDRPFLAGDVAADRFEIVREIARGGMAVVYEAYDRKADRKVALKCPQAAFRKRLLSELHNALRVSHPNVCRLYEIHGAQGRDGEVDVLTMELLEGETLLQRLQRGPLDRAEAGVIARQLCSGLAEAHACGVVHGDLKPGNVILTKSPDGSTRAAITDFGLARSVGLMDPARLGNASLRGTPAYIAPELWQGTPPSPASDIYALGVMLRELLGAKNLPGRWEGILRACVAAEVGRRPRSANLVGAALAPVRPFALWAACAAAAFAAGGGVYYHSTLPVIPDVVRLAILPAQTDSASAAIGSGVEYDLSDRLGTRSAKPLVVISLAQARRYHATSGETAGTTLGATHALLLRWTNSGESYQVIGDVLETSDNRRIGGFKKTYDQAALGKIPDDVGRALTSTFGRDVFLGGGAIASAAYADYAQSLHLMRDAKDWKNARAALDRARQAGDGVLIGLRRAEAGVSDVGSAHREAEAWLGRLNGPLDDPTAVLVARTRAQEGSDRAVQAYRQATRSNPGSGEGWLGLAEALRVNKVYSAEGEAAYRQAIAAEPNYFEPWIGFGLYAYYQGYKGHFEDASARLQRATELAPGEARAHRNWADTLIRLEDYARAEREYKQALTTEQEAATLIGIGALLSEQGRADEAIPYNAQAAAASPSDPLPHSNLADSYRRSGRPEARAAYEETLASADRALALPTAAASDRAFRAYAEARLGRRSEALSEVARAMRAAPDDTLTRRIAVSVYEALGLRDKALEQFAARPALFVELRRDPDLADLRRDPRFLALERLSVAKTR